MKSDAWPRCRAVKLAPGCGVVVLADHDRDGYICRRTNVRGTMAAFYYLFNKVIGLYIWVVIAAVIVNLLIAFNVISAYNPYVKALARGLYSVTEPALQPIRKFMPNLGGLDFSPVVLIIGLQFFQILINDWVFHPILSG